MLGNIKNGCKTLLKTVTTMKTQSCTVFTQSVDNIQSSVYHLKKDEISVSSRCSLFITSWNRFSSECKGTSGFLFWLHGVMAPVRAQCRHRHVDRRAALPSGNACTPGVASARCGTSGRWWDLRFLSHMSWGEGGFNGDLFKMLQKKVQGLKIWYQSV